MDEVITPLDQEIGKILITTLDKSKIIDQLIALLRTKQEEIDYRKAWISNLLDAKQELHEQRLKALFGN